MDQAFRPYWPHGVPKRRKPIVQWSQGLGDPLPAEAQVIWTNPVNREGCGLRYTFRGDKSATWTASATLIDAEDPTKWVRFDEGSITGETTTVVTIPDVEATPDVTGPGGAPDFRALGRLVISAANDSPAHGDQSLVDDIEFFGGALNGVVLDSGDLVNQALGDPFWPQEDSSPFWGGADESEFWQDSLYLDGIAEFSVTPDIDSVPSDLRIEINSDVGVDYYLEYKVGSRFVLFPGLVPITTLDPFVFRLRLAGGSNQGRVTTLNVIFDVPDQREMVENVTIADSGTARIPITKSYRSIRRVEVAILAPSNGGRSWVLIDKDPEGPAIEIYDSGGSRVEENVDAFIEGVLGVDQKISTATIRTITGSQADSSFVISGFTLPNNARDCSIILCLATEESGTGGAWESTGPDWDGNAMTLGVKEDHVSANSIHCAIWHLHGLTADGSSGDLIIPMEAGVSSRGLVARAFVAYDLVDQAPEDTDTDEGTGNPLSSQTTITPVSDNALVIDVLADGSGSLDPGVTGTGQIEIGVTTQGGTTQFMGLSTSYRVLGLAAEGAQNLGWSDPGNPFRFVQATAVYERS